MFLHQMLFSKDPVSEVHYTHNCLLIYGIATGCLLSFTNVQQYAMFLHQMLFSKDPVSEVHYAPNCLLIYGIATDCLLSFTNVRVRIQPGACGFRFPPPLKTG